VPIVILLTATAAVVALVSRAAMRSQAVSTRPPVVLIVSDDDEACALYAIALHLIGVHPLAAATPDEAFARACEHHPDVVVTDLALGRSSLDLLGRLHGDGRTRAATLMALTPQTSRGIARQARVRGCHRLILKPCAPEALAREVLKALSADHASPFGAEDLLRTAGPLAWTDAGHRTTF
jgi:two-component system response regulator ResD